MHDHLNTVATFHDPVAAALARTYLGNEGIPAILLDETTIATDWMLAGAIGGIKLQVSAYHIERAEHLLAQLRAEREADEAAADPEHAIAASLETAEELRAQREDKAEINQLVDRLFRSAVFGLIFWPLQFYALYLLLQIRSAEGLVSQDRRKKVWLSVVMNLPIMSAIALPLFFLVGYLFPGAGSPEKPVWRRYVYADHGFSVLFPHKPEMTTFHSNTEKGKTVEHNWQAGTFGRLYWVRVTRMPEKWAPVPVDDLVLNYAASRGGQVLKDKTVSLANPSDKEFIIEFQFPEVKAQERLRVYRRGHTVFLVAVLAGELDLFSREGDDFMRSFEIHEP